MPTRNPFKRPARFKPCPRCGGSGAIQDSYALASNQRRIKGAPKDALSAIVVGSFDIFTACREALPIANRTKRPVVFDFNEQLVVIRAGDDPDKIARAWWFKAYGKTPEQSLADR